MRTVALVHGAWHGPWCWAPVLARLDELGVPAVAVDLPLTDLHTDADHVRAELDRLDVDVVLAGHSYGGAVITDAGTHPAVEHLVYVSAFPLDAGERVDVDLVPGGETSELGRVVHVDGDRAVLDLDAVPDVLYGDCDPVDVERAVALLRPQPLDTWRQSPRAVAWRERPTTYVVCTGDRALPAPFQRNLAARIPGVALVELPGASHSPFFSRPGELVDVLVALA